jgi:hypothetical protein
VVDSCGVIVAASRGIGEGIVGIIYELKLAGSFRSFWGVCGDAVRVGFEGCSVRLVSFLGEVVAYICLPFVCVTDLLLCC